MNDDFVKRLKNGGVDIYGDNGELMTCASPEILADFLSATNARHFSHHFDPNVRHRLQQQEIASAPAKMIPWEDREGPVYGDNHELVAILPAKLKL